MRHLQMRHLQMIKPQIKQPLFLLIPLLLSVVTLSCSPVTGVDAGGVTLTASSGSDYILLDAKAKSCKSLESGNDAADDVNELYMNLGKFKIEWELPVDENKNSITAATLKIIYLRITPRSAGLASQDARPSIASQDLNCVFTNGSTTTGVINNSLMTLIPGTNKYTYTFTDDLLVGDFKPKDATKRTSFSGTAEVLAYFVVQQPGGQETPAVARTTIKFKFDGI
jgi:hypothetical protein